MIETIGIDLGNVMVRQRKPVEDAFRVVGRLVNERFGKQSYIISRVNEEQEVRARAFVSSADFVSIAQIPVERVHYCRERREKGKICEELGVTVMIDDRTEVMLHLPDSVNHRFLFNPTEEDVLLLRGYPHIEERVTIVRSWKEAESLLLPCP
jgi:hypothetical protein